MQKMNKNILEAIQPKSIAIVGASSHPEKIGYQILANLIDGGYKGYIYPVNLKNETILGKKVYASLDQITRIVDLVVIALPRDLVLSTVQQCVKKNVSMIAVISAGFSEFDQRGNELQSEIVGLCEKNNIHLLGPNCLGFINNDQKLNATFSNGSPDMGPLSFLSQSGALISSVIDWSRQTGMGFNKIFSLGNKSILGENDLLELLYSDPKTEVILGYFESFDINNDLTKLLTRYAKTKPTIFLLGGKSSVGATAAKSHTGSIVTPYLTLKTYLTQLGVVVASDIEELFLFAKAFSKVKKIRGDKVVIVSNAGGPAVAATDSVVENGLSLAELSQSTQDSLTKVLQSGSSIKNPVDLLGDAVAIDYQKAIQIVADDKNVDAILVLATPQSNTPISDIATDIAKTKSKKPIFASFIGGEAVTIADSILNKSDVPCFDYPEDAIRSIRATRNFSNDSVRELALVSDGKKIFQESQKFEIIKEYKLPIVEYTKITQAHELEIAVQNCGFPIVMKTANPSIIHKMDGGGVILNIDNLESAKSAFEKIGSPAIIGKMIKTSHEVFLGLKKDINNNVITAFGTGGIYAELYEDLSYRVNLRSSDSVLEMISETTMGKILAGARNQQSFDLDQLSDIILRANQMISDFDNIVEIDFNPIIVSRDGYYIVDARIINKG